MQNTRLAGHGLRYEGKTRDGYGGWTSNGDGEGKCSCGMLSPVLANTSQRKQWHADHKSDITAGGLGHVWEGMGIR